ncbi:MAG: pyruvate, phosphate dikinase [Candidatus Nealsonbacteria bacterium]
MKKTQKFIYYFGGKKAEGSKDMKDLLGGKGANLAEMINLGIPVPPGFTVTTKVCNYSYQYKGKLPQGFDVQFKKTVERLEKEAGKKLGDAKDPLLVSIRSGSKFSMPGMMDTILNLGLNDEIVEGLAVKTKNPRFAFDAYRRFIQMFGNIVLAVPKEEFEHILTKSKEALGVKFDTEIREEGLKNIIAQYKALIKRKTNSEIPQDVLCQLVMARDAVFKSWGNPRAVTYRRLNKISESLGTAVNVQVMVFGNTGDTGATGVGFTRDPSTGEKKFYGEYLTNAQGEDVVAGIRTPKQITNLAQEMPAIFKQLLTATTRLEKHYRDIQDFEFTIENGKLFLLQTRTGKRTAAAAVKIAVDMVKEKLITKEEALMRIDPDQINQLLHPIIDPKAKVNVIAKGLPASPGAASGKVVFTADKAVQLADEKLILVRTETCPDDIHGMDAAQGILTARGGMTSHAAVVARGMGKCCIAGCEEIKINEAKGEFRVGNIIVKEGDVITLDGSTGRVILGKVPTIDSALSSEFNYLMDIVDKTKKLGVRANADIPRDAKTARKFGAQGIGLCRTEHMFFDEARLPIMQKMILSEDEASRRKALQELLPFQKEDFKGLFSEMEGHAVTIRMIDPPLHEFLPKNEIEAQKLSEKIGIPAAKILAKSDELHEVNPMLGHRGCRLGITYPEITEMQTRAIISAACELYKEKKIRVVPEIMIPLVGDVAEFRNQKEIVDRVAMEVMKQYGAKIIYTVGTMIEVPRAAITADKIAKEAEFFSFGTNDLTQMGMGFSRDDAAKFTKVYLEKKILKADPFQTLDQEGIGQLIILGIKKGRSVKKNLKIGICGEHGGDPESVKFCHRAGMDYVSCSPYRVSIAKFAAAQAVIEDKLKIEYTSK